jgi:hypothetical protein
LDKVKDAYLSAADSVGAFNQATDSAKTFHEQIQVLTKNLSSLNTIYELELQESNNHLKALNAFYGKLSETSASMLNRQKMPGKCRTRSVIWLLTWDA